MTKKHFIKLADFIRQLNGSNDRFTAEQLIKLSRFCRSQNENFNEARWLGYIAGECGPNGGRITR